MGLDQDPVDFIVVTVRTGDLANAGSNGEVYLSLGGREFNLKRADIKDRERGQVDSYRLGRGANIEQPDRNDPRSLLEEGLRNQWLGFGSGLSVTLTAPPGQFDPPQDQ